MWTDLDPDMCLLKSSCATRHLSCYLEACFGKFGRAAVDNSVRFQWPIINKQVPFTFNMTLILHVTFLRNMQVFLKIFSFRYFDRCFAHLCATIGSGYIRGLNLLYIFI